jgi:hypothetical protein
MARKAFFLDIPFAVPQGFVRFGPDNPGVIFKPLSQAEYDRLSIDERMAYLHRLMTDIRQKLAETRKQQEATKKRLDKR